MEKANISDEVIEAFQEIIRTQCDEISALKEKIEIYGRLMSVVRVEMDTPECVEKQELQYMNEYDIDLDEFSEKGFKTYVCEKASAYDRLMSGGKKAIEETCKAFKISDIGEFSDGFHTFNTLYHQRAVLFATLVNTYSSHSWKSYRHEDGQICFGGGWFIVGIDTPKGSYTYHYENKYWDMFNCQTYENAKHWDGHTDDDVERLLTLPDGWEEK